jgi:outer membrane protein, multidrug efflux system
MLKISPSRQACVGSAGAIRERRSSHAKWTIDLLRRLFLLSTAAALGACTLGPDGKPPDSADLIAPAWRASAPTAVSVWPAPEWWTGFNSPELNDLIARAKAENFDIIAAAARIRQANAALVAAGAPLLPTATASTGDQWSRYSYAHANSRGAEARNNSYYETRVWNLTPTVSYEVDLWGRVRATRDAALATALASRFDQETVALTVVTGVADTWFQALATQDRLDVARRNLRDSEEILRAIQARLDAGTANQLDVAQQAALVAGIRASVPALQNQLQQFINGLGILTGQSPEAITVRPGTLNALSLPEVAPGLPSELLARRPDVAYAEAALQSASASVRAARAAMLPKVELTATGGWQAFSLGMLFGPGSFFAQTATSVTQTLFDNAALAANVEQARGRADELVADYRKAIVQSFTDVENALTAYRYTTEQEALERNAVATAQLAADIARAQVIAGTSDMVTALQAQTTLFTDLDLLAQVRESRFLALVSLYKALGGGWSREDTAPPETHLLQGVL